MRAFIEREARDLGFGRVGFARPPLPHPERLLAALAEGRHGDMEWLAETAPTRLDPSRLLPHVKGAVVLGLDYAHPVPPDPGGLTGRVSCYAWGRDYHNLVGKRLRKLQRRLEAAFPGLNTWAGVDRGATWERAWAEAAGLGYAGRNGCIIAPGDTSYFFLGLVLLDREVEAGRPLADHCGTCRRCVAACPTDALPGDGSVDARLCISYLTIEHDGPIPVALRPRVGRWLFGCDVCQAVCPHIKTAAESEEADLAPRNAWLDLETIVESTDVELITRFTGTPLRRAAPRRLRRNAVTVLGNLGEAALPVLERAARHPDPWTAEAARWALAYASAT